MRYLQHLGCLRWLWYYILALNHCTGILSSTIPKSELVKTIHKNISDTFGWISPEGIVYKSIGEHLELFCTINLTTVETTSYTSSNLYFYEDEYLLSCDNVNRVNETTISLYIVNRQASNHLYTCILNGSKTKPPISALQDIRVKGDKKTGLSEPDKNQGYGIPPISKDVDESEILIGTTRVLVGEKPKDAVNFCCHYEAIDPDKIYCHWDNPKNLVSTKYAVYRLSPDSTTLIEFDFCDVELFYCFWINGPPYRYRNRDSHNFTIIGTNVFGKSQQTFLYDIFIHYRPETLKAVYVQRNSSSIDIQWSTRLNSVEQHPLQLIFYACFRIYHQLMAWNCINFSEEVRVPHVQTWYNVSKLTSNTLYEFRICFKFSEAPESGAYWSDYAVQTFTTTALPSREDIDLFKIFQTSEASQRQVSIFWTPHKNFDETGKFSSSSIGIFHVDENGRKQLVAYQNKSMSYPYGSSLSTTNTFYLYWWKKSPVYTIDIGLSAYCFVRKLENYEGDNTSISFNIPAFKNEVEFCPFFYVVQHANNTYEYIWQPPEKNLGIVNYTLFWSSRNDYFYINTQIFVNMNWTHLSINQSTIPFNFGPSITNVSIYYENKWDFYIGGNTKNYRSSLQDSMELISSVSDFWKSERYLQLEKEMLDDDLVKIKAEHDSKPPLNIGRTFSENQFQDWMYKLHAVEQPETCKGRKNMIRVREHY